MAPMLILLMKMDMVKIIVNSLEAHIKMLIYHLTFGTHPVHMVLMVFMLSDYKNVVLNNYIPKDHTIHLPYKPIESLKH